MSTKLHELIAKNRRQTLGLMAGTSGDGLDIAYCEVCTAEKRLRNILAATYEYPQPLREYLLDVAEIGEARLGELIALSQTLGRFYADSVLEFCRVNRIEFSEIDLIGSHGQTIAHLATPVSFLEQPVRGTLQLGEAEIVAKTIGAVTVSDFRSADIAVGGSGAPLTPIYHQLRFAEDGRNKIIVNVGGIANVTLLQGTLSVVATDTGPGNCLADSLMRRYYQRPYDAGGKMAAQGEVSRELLEAICRQQAFSGRHPRSHDRKEILEVLESDEVRRMIAQSRPNDVIATATGATAHLIKMAVEELAADTGFTDILVCGGGAHNRTLMVLLADEFPAADVSTTEDLGSNPDFVEAEAFAYLANLCLDSIAGNIPQVTGAARHVVMGKISQP